MRMQFLVLALNTFMLASLVPSLSHAQDGLAIATVAVPKDASSEREATIVSEIARQSFARNPRYSAVDLVRVLDSERPRSLELLQKARERLNECKGAYDEFELQSAVESCAESVVLFEQSADASEKIDELVEALTYQGASAVLAGNAKKGKRTFVRVHALAPSKLLPRGFPETVKDVFAEAQAKAEKNTPGSVTIYSTPSAGAVWVDGKFRGATPLTIDPLSVGRHIVRVTHDGYKNHATVVDIKKRRSATVEATLSATEKLSSFDDRVSRIKEGRQEGMKKMAALLKVDQLMVLEVNAAGDDVRVRGVLTDGVSGKTISEANKTFVSSSPRYRNDVQLWVSQNFRKDRNDVPDDEGSQNDKLVSGEGDSGFKDAPKVREVESPKTSFGWTMVGVSAVPLVVGIGAGVYSLYTWDIYKNGGNIFQQTPIPNQLDPNLPGVRNAFLASSLIADVGYVLFAATLGTGIALVIAGNTEEEELEDVLSQRVPEQQFHLVWGQP